MIKNNTSSGQWVALSDGVFVELLNYQLQVFREELIKLAKERMN